MPACAKETAAGGLQRGDLLMFPYFAGFELAPTTAKAGEEKKALAAASVPTMMARSSW